MDNCYSFAVDIYNPKHVLYAIVTTKYPFSTHPVFILFLNSPKPSYSHTSKAMAIIIGNIKAQIAEIVPTTNRESSWDAYLKWIPAEYAKLKQLNSIKASINYLRILWEIECKAGAQFLKMHVAIIKKIQINSKTMTTRSIILQFRIKLEVYSIEEIRYGVVVVFWSKRLLFY